jgi:L-ascorbate metabolism protein UlaG (beta-lactamase superfamily)
VSGFSLRFLGHSTVRIELGDRVLLTDPVLTGRVGPLARVAPALSPDSWSGVDTVLISHLHGDHLHLPSLRLLGRATRLIVPRGAGDWLRRRGFTRVREILPGEEIDDGELRITGTTAEHSGHRWGPRLTHGPQAPAVGHLVESAQSRIYAAGDTDLFDGMAELGERRLDVALLPVWGWGPTLGPGHLDPWRAARAVELLRPRFAVPVHWGTLAPAGLCRVPFGWGARMRGLLAGPPREFAAAVSGAGSVTEVVVTEPGEHVLPARSGS